ncbi:TPA: methyltransferase domain-containing protein [Photobacterium damselae]
MHPSAMYHAKLFSENYLKSDNLKIVEIGSQDVNGCLKSVIPDNVDYVGVDFVDGNNVDIILDDPYKLPFEDESIDVVMSSSCFEHSEFFWEVYLEIMRVLKPSGILYINVPNNGYIHRYPVDCWRFYPDSAMALTNWGKRHGMNNFLLESFVCNQSNFISNIREIYDEIDWSDYLESEGRWNDFVAVILKNEEFENLYSNRISYDDRLRAFSFYINNNPNENLEGMTEDFIIQDNLNIHNFELSDKLFNLEKDKALIDSRVKDLEDENIQYKNRISRIENLKIWPVIKYFLKSI